MSTVTVYKPHPDPWHPFQRERSDRRCRPAAPAAVLDRQDRRGGRRPLLRPRVRSAGDDRAHGVCLRRPRWAPVCSTSRTSLRVEPVVARWDPLPYSPIHYDDINAQIEPLLGAAGVPATIVNWAGDVPVTVAEWSRYFAELLGMEAEVVVEPVPGASVGSVADDTKRTSVTGPLPRGLERWIPRHGSALLPRPGQGRVSRVERE